MDKKIVADFVWLHNKKRQKPLNGRSFITTTILKTSKSVDQAIRLYFIACKAPHHLLSINLHSQYKNFYINKKII